LLTSDDKARPGADEKEKIPASLTKKRASVAR
jgi:hypothetical protein